MPFTLQDPTSGLFWTSGIFGRVQLGTTPNTYVLEGSYIKNVETGNYVNHRADLLHEGGESEEFVFEADGTITTQGKSVTASQFVHVMDGEATKWIKTEDEESEVPVPRASALIEEALNASKACGCECGCAAGCDGCECKDCGCPKPEPEAEEETSVSPQ
jgi:hypothetical protein